MAPSAASVGGGPAAGERRIGFCLWACLLAAVAAGFAAQYGLALARGGAGPVPLISTFNAAHYAFGYARQGFIKRGLIGTLFTGLSEPARLPAILVFNAIVLSALAGLVARSLVVSRRVLEPCSFALLVAI